MGDYNHQPVLNIMGVERFSLEYKKWQTCDIKELLQSFANSSSSFLKKISQYYMFLNCLEISVSKYLFQNINMYKYKYFKIFKYFEI